MSNNKNILFYSIHPNDTNSKQFMTLLNKYSYLKQQFILVCVNDPNIKIPQIILDIGTTPVLLSQGHGFNKPIIGTDAVSWLENGNMQDKANGMDYGSFNDTDISQYAILSNENVNSEYHQYHNADYNRGFDFKDANINSNFSKLTENNHVETYDDSGEKKNNTIKLDKRLEELKSMRKAEVPSTLKRIDKINTSTEFIQQIPIGREPIFNVQSNSQYIQPISQMPAMSAMPELPFKLNQQFYQRPQNTYQQPQQKQSPQLPFNFNYKNF